MILPYTIGVYFALQVYASRELLLTPEVREHPLEHGHRAFKQLYDDLLERCMVFVMYVVDVRRRKRYGAVLCDMEV